MFASRFRTFGRSALGDSNTSSCSSIFARSILSQPLDHDRKLKQPSSPHDHHAQIRLQNVHSVLVAPEQTLRLLGSLGVGANHVAVSAALWLEGCATSGTNVDHTPCSIKYPSQRAAIEMFMNQPSWGGRRLSQHNAFLFKLRASPCKGELQTSLHEH